MSVKLREMLEKRNTAVTMARALVDKADAEKRMLNKDEERQYDAYMKDAIDLRENIDREQTLMDEEKRNISVKLGQQEDRQVQTPEAELRSKAFRTLLSEGAHMLSRDEVRALTTGSDTQAGFLNAPQEFVKNVIVAVKNLVFMRSLGTNFTTTNANGLGFPTIENDVDDAEWTPEIVVTPEDTALSFGKRELKPHPSKKLIKISDKLLRSDGIDPEAIVMDRVAYKYGVTEEKAFLLGDGNQKPLGVFTPSKQGIDTDRDFSTDMLADDFTPDALKGAKYSLKAQYMANASWLFHRDGVAKVAKLKTGDGYYMFELADQVGDLDRLLGRPLKMSEYAPNTFAASNYVGMFGDFSWYYIATSLNLRVQRLNELFALNSLVGFKFDMECDGMPVLSEAFTRIKTAAA